MEYSRILENIDPSYGCRIARELSLIGNDESTQGFKNAGSTGEKKAAAYIMKEMREIGLANVSVDKFEVDAWEFRGSKLTYMEYGKRVSCPLSAFAGTRGVNNGEINASVIDAGYGTYRECASLALDGKIAFIRVDLNKEYWVGTPAYQLELMGAVAVITMLEGETFGNHEEVLNSADLIGSSKIPVLNISRVDGKKLERVLKNTEIKAVLQTEISLNSGESGNIIGEIPGRDAHRCILLGAHYDSFFHAYLDDAFGVGAVMAIVKALIDSGYEPEHTIRIIVHGAEEFGVKDSHYDWCIGSWRQINDIRPEWVQQVRLFMNIDATVPDAEEFLIQASPQLHTFLEKSLNRIGFDIRKDWKQGYKVTDINGPWSDDFNYYMAGIPVLICGRGKSYWKNRFYHTNYDYCGELNEKLMSDITCVYLWLLYDYDKSDFAPLNIFEEFGGLKRIIDEELLVKEGIDLADWNKAFLDMLELLDSGKNQKGFSSELFESGLNKRIVRAVRALDLSDNLIYRLQAIQENIRHLNNISEYVREEDPENALKEVTFFSGSEVMKNFDNEVYEYHCVEILNEKTGRLQWGRGLIENPIDIRSLNMMLDSEWHVDGIIREIMSLKKQETEKAEKYIKNITDVLLESIIFIEKCNSD